MLGLPKKEELEEEEEEECQIAIFSSRGAYVNLHLFDWKSAVEHDGSV